MNQCFIVWGEMLLFYIYLCNRWHFLRLLIDNCSSWRALLEDNLGAISEAIHSLSHELPKKPTRTRSPTTSTTVYGIVDLSHVTVPFLHAISWWPWRHAKLTNNYGLSQNILRVFNMCFYPFVNKCSLSHFVWAWQPTSIILIITL